MALRTSQERVSIVLLRGHLRVEGQWCNCCLGLGESDLVILSSAMQSWASNDYDRATQARG
jgi:hypothetical protein